MWLFLVLQIYELFRYATYFQVINFRRTRVKICIGRADSFPCCRRAYGEMELQLGYRFFSTFLLPLKGRKKGEGRESVKGKVTEGARKQKVTGKGIEGKVKRNRRGGKRKDDGYENIE